MKMKPLASRMDNMGRSFIREILIDAQRPEVISFAGGLPHPDFFPVADYAAASVNAFVNHGRTMLQYSPTPGYMPLREFVADRYTSKFNTPVSPEEVMIAYNEGKLQLHQKNSGSRQ